MLLEDVVEWPTSSVTHTDSMIFVCIIINFKTYKYNYTSVSSCIRALFRVNSIKFTVILHYYN